MRGSVHQTQHVACLFLGAIVAVGGCEKPSSMPSCEVIECDQHCRSAGTALGTCTEQGCLCVGVASDGGEDGGIDADRRTDADVDGDTGVDLDAASADGSRPTDADRGDSSVDVPEVCNGVDDDGDGSIDELCACDFWVDEDLPCGGTPEAFNCRQTCEVTIFDLDGDGEVDVLWSGCEPNRTSGEEICDGVDNDCDGEIDEPRGCGGTPAMENCLQFCDGGRFEDSCRSAGSSSAPPEECDDGIDNDCDGAVDEDCQCEAFAVQRCGAGGDCVQNCLYDPEGTGYRWWWGECVNLESTGELCTNNVDDDCDGVVNEGCGCTEGERHPCGGSAPLSVCVKTCTDGVFSDCTPNPPLGGVERCGDLHDNDCDGIVNEGCGCALGESRICGASRYDPICLETCIDGHFSACLPNPPNDGVERCGDGFDNDCDGIIDEGCGCTAGETRPCGGSAPEPICLETCFDGHYSTCRPSPPNDGIELCDDDLDNDCDGRIDEGCGCEDGDMRPCGGSAPLTVCVETCVDGRFSECLPNPPTGGFELCDDGLDNDCDGMVDDGCLCEEGETRPCGGSVPEGPCMETCSEWRFSSCVSSLPGGGGEICDDGLDNDCNGLVDEGCL